MITCKLANGASLFTAEQEVPYRFEQVTNSMAPTYMHLFSNFEQVNSIRPSNRKYLPYSMKTNRNRILYDINGNEFNVAIFFKF